MGGASKPSTATRSDGGSYSIRTPSTKEEMKGIAVFAGGKLAQRPFFFNLTGGLTGQHGAEYLAGQVIADFIDQLPADLIATERQRVNWERVETAPLLDWGQSRLRRAFREWARLRGKEKDKTPR